MSHPVDVICPDGQRYVANDPHDIPCVWVCPDGSWGVMGHFECPAETASTRAPDGGHADAGPSIKDMVGGVFAAVALVALVVAAIALYFLPAAVASRRKHQNSEAIFVLNLLAGWTFLGWVVAMVWATTAPRRE